jgi:hypothetical protein
MNFKRRLILYKRSCFIESLSQTLQFFLFHFRLNRAIASASVPLVNINKNNYKFVIGTSGTLALAGTLKVLKIAIRAGGQIIRIVGCIYFLEEYVAEQKCLLFL